MECRTTEAYTRIYVTGGRLSKGISPQKLSTFNLYHTARLGQRIKSAGGAPFRPVNPQKGELLQPQDRVKPGGKVTKEVTDPLTDVQL